MKKTTAILSLTILLSCNSNTDTDGTMTETGTRGVASAVVEAASEAGHESDGYKKYDVKSGIITFETNTLMGSSKISSRKILYFDDYGLKECEEEYQVDATGKEELDSRNFVKEGYRYNCSVSYKNGARTKAMGYGVAPQFNAEEASSMKDNDFKMLTDEDVCGKKCKSFSMKTASGNIIMNGWNGITLRTKLENPEMKLMTETKAVKLEENVAIPAEKFEVPQGVVMKEM